MSGSTGGQATISSCFYLLVKYTEVTPKQFKCKGEPKIKGFKASEITGYQTWEDEDCWDFGDNPLRHYSYSYHMPFNQFALSTASSEPALAVAADRSPWLDIHVTASTISNDWGHFVPRSQDTTPMPEEVKKYQKGNTRAHQRDGQNVLYMDSHVAHEKVSYCGISWKDKNDNIYTPVSTSGNYPIEKGNQPPPKPPQNYPVPVPMINKDSILVNDFQ